MALLLKVINFMTLKLKRIFFSRNVSFDESASPQKPIKASTPPMAVFSEDSEIPEPECQTPDNPPPEEHQPEPVLRRSTRNIIPPTRYGSWDYADSPIEEEGLIISSSNSNLGLSMRLLKLIVILNPLKGNLLWRGKLCL